MMVLFCQPRGSTHIPQSICRVSQEAERKRQADEAARIEAETKAREANKAHKAKVNNAALSAFIAEGLTAECAKLAVMLIAQKKIPGITINY